MTDYYSSGDVLEKLGCWKTFSKPGMVQLVLSRNLIVHGSSRRVLKMIKNLVDNQRAICLSRNHSICFDLAR